MPTIHYDGTGDATPEQADAVLEAARGWHNGDDQVLGTVEIRHDVEAVRVTLSWTVPESEVQQTVTALDNALAGLGAGLPTASESARVEYAEGA